MLFLTLLIYEYVPFEKRDDNILQQYSKDINLAASGSIGQWYNGKCNPTYPEHVIDSEERKTDWCSNINSSKSDFPWLNVNLRGKAIQLVGYSIRSGCCYYDCCCIGDRIVDCCCWLYSWSLQGSHDNKTWITLHTVKADRQFYYCANRHYDFESKEAYEYIRLIQDEPWPGCNYCICINKLELYGSVRSSSNYYESFEDGDSDDTVSIIGKINKNADN